MTSLRGVLLDIDDTLLDTTGAMLRASRVAMEQLWPGGGEEMWQQAAVRFRVDPAGHFKRYVAGELEFAAMRAARLAEVAAHFGVELTESATDTYESAYRPVFRAAQVMYDDVVPFVARARSAGIAVGALTNASAQITEDKLDALRAHELFDVVVTKDTLGFGKPDPRVFHHACELLGTKPERTAYVGDEMEADAIGALRAGLQAYWLRRPGRDVAVTPDAGLGESGVPSGIHVIRSLADVDLGDLDLGQEPSAR